MAYRNLNINKSIKELVQHTFNVMAGDHKIPAKTLNTDCLGVTTNTVPLIKYTDLMVNMMCTGCNIIKNYGQNSKWSLAFIGNALATLHRWNSNPAHVKDENIAQKAKWLLLVLLSFAKNNSRNHERFLMIVAKLPTVEISKFITGMQKSGIFDVRQQTLECIYRLVIKALQPCGETIICITKGDILPTAKSFINLMYSVRDSLGFWVPDELWALEVRLTNKLADTQKNKKK